jgi:hypothetical protein
VPADNPPPLGESLAHGQSVSHGQSTDHGPPDKS